MLIEVLLETGAKQIDKTFTYLVPNYLEKEVEIGKRVTVPFGNRKIEGFILKITNEKVEYKLKEIINVIDDIPVLNEEMIELANYMINKYMSLKSQAFQTLLPNALKAKKNNKINKKYKTYLILNKSINEAENYIEINKAIKQNEILERLASNEEVLKNEYAASTVESLIKKGFIKEEKREEYRYKKSVYELENKKELTDEQKSAYNEIKNKINTKNTILLQGITGSGKTEIYMHIIDDIIKENKEAIVLVPEISLTEQMINRFIKRFGENVAVLHSGLSNGEKYDEWRKILRKEVKIVVGARSAIFAPFNNLGIIIVDEEHEHTYKSENNPKYHARDIAIWRSSYHNCPTLLGSATPSLESYARAKKGVYKLIELKERVGEAALPDVEIISMSDEYKKGNKSIFSERLKELIIDRIKKHEQIILLLNRRGYTNYTNCNACGYIEKCPNCDITLTYHKSSNVMSCHYCDYRKSKMIKCPECGSEDIREYGYGTEKLEEEIITEFGAKVIRMDRDTTGAKGSHEKILKKFKNREYDILLGTQMIAKGLDFPLVTLVGVLNADTSLNIPDFRSSERTYQLLSQVSGRAGRGSIPGKVIIQTFNPENYSIKEASKHDFESFYNKEMEIRKKLGYSPYYYISTIKILSKDPKIASINADKIANHLKKNKELITLGPNTGNIFKINNIYRFVIILKYKNEEVMKKEIENIKNHYINNNKINIDIDIDTIRI